MAESKQIVIRNVKWHHHDDSSSERDSDAEITANGTITITRNSPTDKNVSVSGTITQSLYRKFNRPPANAWSSSSNKYNHVEYAGVTSWVTCNNSSTKRGRTGYKKCPDTDKYFGDYNYSKGDGHCEPLGTSNSDPWDETISIDSMNWTSGDLIIHCGCIWLASGVCDYGRNDEEVGRLTWANSMYNPYSPPSTYSVTPPAMMRIDQTYSPNVHIKCGSGGSIHWIDLVTFPSDKSWSYGKWVDIAQSVKNSAIGRSRIYTDNNHTQTEINQGFNYKPNSNGCTDGTQYKLAAHFSDCNYEYLSGDDKSFKTYRKPTMSITVPANRVSPQDNATWSWSTNQRRWTGNNEEDPFTTTGKYTCSSVDKSITGISQDTSGSYTLNATHLNSYFTAAQRSVSRLSASVTLVRENTKAKVGTSAYTASDTKSFTIQYQPNKTPTGGSVTDDNNQSVKNKLIYIQETPTINLDWAYGFGGEDGGVANGYIVRVYKKSDYTDKFGNDIIINVTTPGSAGTARLNTKTQLKRGIMNYATITPFYTKPDGTGRIEGTSPLKTVLCKPVSKLNAPTIDYPINNTTWHNKNFRILLQLPIDDDLSELQADGKVTQANPYRYKNIEVVIEANSSSNTYTKTNTTIYSKTLANMNYNEKIAICPGLLTSHPEAPSYTIKIRLQSNYYDLSDTDAWGYVATRVVKNTAVNRQTFVAGETQILIGHYKYVRDASVRLHSVYPIKALDSNNVSKDQYDEIKHINYQGISNTIRGIQEKVNSYCTYDNTSVQFTQTINDIVSKQEYITAQDRPSDIAGRNYMNILVDDMNKLT